VVMEINLGGELNVIGALADSVHNVMEIDADQIEAAPKIGSRWDTDFIKGIGKHGNTFIIILNVDRIFSTEELVMVQSHDATQIDDNQQAA
jgi:purine-binding chemotaxis protein CheW